MRDNRGFTILELMILLSGLAIVAALAIPAWFNRPDVTLENASVLLAQDLRSAQNRSAYLGAPCSVIFMEDGTGYAVLDQHGGLIRNPRTAKPFRRRYPVDGVFRGVTITSVDLGQDRALNFDDNGLVIGGGTITVSFGGETRTLEVEDGSGRIRIRGTTSGWEDLGY